MKKLIIPIVLFTITFFATSCKKNTAETVVTPEDIAVSKKQNIQTKEPVTVNYTKGTAGATVKWSVTPSKDVFIEKMGNQAKFRFGKSGDYTIKAFDGINTATTSVNVSAARYNGSDSSGGNI